MTNSPCFDVHIADPHCAECFAYLTELQCLLSKLGRCGLDAQCWKDLYTRIKAVTEKAAHECAICAADRLLERLPANIQNAPWGRDVLPQ